MLYIPNYITHSFDFVVSWALSPYIDGLVINNDMPMPVNNLLACLVCFYDLWHTYVIVFSLVDLQGYDEGR